MQNKIMNRMKNNLIESRVTMGIVLIPILIVIGVLGSVLGSLYLPRVLEGLFSVEEYGYVYGVLYPTMWGNLALILVTASTVLIGLGLMIIWFRWVFHTVDLSIMLMEYFVIMCVVICLPALMIHNENVVTTYQMYHLDVEAYKKEEVNTYHGKIVKGKQGYLQIPQSKNLTKGMLQYWECKEENLYLISTSYLNDTIEYKEGTDYQITYLPRTYLITSIKMVEP